MANYRALARQFPAVRDYLRARKWVRRGDVLAYAPSLVTAAFSTDEYGFRHSRFGGRDVGIRDAGAFPRVGVVLGSSHVFGFGLAGNEETLPSRLGEALGYPFLNVSFPEADSRTLHDALLRVGGSLERRLGAVVLAPGGDYTRFCYSGQADPLFGPPFLPQDPNQEKGSGRGRAQYGNIIQFTNFWTAQIARQLRAAGLPFTILHEWTFFEKARPDAIEEACGLGTGGSPGQIRRFAIHRAGSAAYSAGRRKVAEARKLSEVVPADPDALLYMDEFHFRAETLADLAGLIAAEIEKPALTH